VTHEITGLCEDHSFESAENVCRRCGLEYCELCLVYPFGAKKPLCKECAMVVGGVRSQATRPEMARRDLKRRIKAWGARASDATSAAAAATAANPVLNDPLAPTEDDLERVPSMVPDNGAEIAAELADAFSEPPAPPMPPAPPAQPAQEPADGVAPPIDWSQPFG